MARSSCTCSRPVTPRPTTTALASGDTVTPDSACTQVDSTWIRAASSAVTPAGSGCSRASGTATYSAKQPSRSRPSSPPRAHRCGRSGGTPGTGRRRRPGSPRPGRPRARLPRDQVPPPTRSSRARAPGARSPGTRQRRACGRCRRCRPRPPAPARARRPGAGTSRTVTAPGRSMTAASMVQCSHRRLEGGASDTADTAVGFVGLGTMGSALSAHLLAAGWRVTGYDIDPARLAAHTGRGGRRPPARPAPPPARTSWSPRCPPRRRSRRRDGRGRAGRRPPAGPGGHRDLHAAARREAPGPRRPRRRGTVLLDCPLSGTGGQALTKDVVAYLSGPAQAKARRGRCWGR